MLKRADAESLLSVDLEFDPDQSTDIRDSFKIIAHGQKIGGIAVRRSDESREAWVYDVEIVDSPSYRGVELGTSSHIDIAARVHNKGYTFICDPLALSDDGIAVWDRFVERGIADEEVPSRFSGSKDFPHKARIVMREFGSDQV